MFLIISDQILKMSLLIIVGYLCYKLKLVDHHGNKILSNLLLLVVNPLLVINSLQMEYQPSLMKGLFIALLLSMLTHIAGIFISRLFFPKKRSEDYNIEQFSCIYTNCGFMGIPLVSSVLGNEGVLYLIAYMLIFNIFAWTHGLTLMTGNTSLKQLKKGLASPVLIGGLIGLVLFLLRIQIPPAIHDAMGYIAGMNTPMAMLVAGVSLAESDLLAALKKKNLYLVTACKLVLFPLVILGCFTFLPVGSKVLYPVLIAAACPTATTGTMFALRYNGNYKYASEIFALTTLLSMATIPGIVFLAEQLLH